MTLNAGTGAGTNPIRRRFRGRWYFAFTADARRESPRANREWLAICPHCGAEVTAISGHPYYAAVTRKNTKDALYRHQQEHDRPGLVGR